MLIIFLSTWLFTACGSMPATEPILITSENALEALPSPTLPEPLTPTVSPTERHPEILSTATQVETETPTSLPKQCVTLSYSKNAQVEILNPDGSRVYIDINDPTLLGSLPKETDVLLTTHTHYDHINETFLNDFPGQQLFTRTGSLKQGEVTILGIASAHNVGDRLKDEGGTNYIYLIDSGGLRIAHFGDIGQDKLTSDQLDAIGQVDVAIMQLSNSYSDMSAENQKGFHLMEQVMPKLIIPTHLNLDAARLAGQKWPAFFTDQLSIEICPANLADSTQLLLMGENASKLHEPLNLPEVDW